MATDILAIIDSSNGLAPIRCQAITWTNAEVLSVGSEQTSAKFESRVEAFFSRKYVWKCLQNVSYFVQALVCYEAKLHERFSASAVFPAKNWTNQQTKTCFALITHLLSVRATSWKMLLNNKFKAQTLTGNPTGNYLCQLLASRALNMSCSFSQSAHSIESRCVVMYWSSLAFLWDGFQCVSLIPLFCETLGCREDLYVHVFLVPTCHKSEVKIFCNWNVLT